MDEIVVIYINPLHINFETNLEIVRDVTSGGTRATQRFQNWYYGQPQQSENESPCGIALVGRDVKKMQSFSQPSGTSPELPSEALSRAPIHC